jgi:hypothetical protein
MKNLKSAVTLSPAIAPFLLTFLLSAQPPTAPTAFPQRIQTLQQAAIENEERLHTYQWIESTTVTMNGSPKPPKQSLCRYTAEGTVAKIPLGPQQQAPQPSGGPLRRHMMEEKNGRSAGGGSRSAEPRGSLPSPATRHRAGYGPFRQCLSKAV